RGKRPFPSADARSAIAHNQRTNGSQQPLDRLRLTLYGSGDRLVQSVPHIGHRRQLSQCYSLPTKRWSVLSALLLTGHPVPLRTTVPVEVQHPSTHPDIRTRASRSQGPCSFPHSQETRPRRNPCATACARSRTPSLRNSRLACVFTVSSDRYSSRPICPL